MRRRVKGDGDEKKGGTVIENESSNVILALT